MRQPRVSHLDGDGGVTMLGSPSSTIQAITVRTLYLYNKMSNRYFKTNSVKQPALVTNATWPSLISTTTQYRGVPLLLAKTVLRGWLSLINANLADNYSRPFSMRKVDRREEKGSSANSKMPALSTGSDNSFYFPTATHVPFSYPTTNYTNSPPILS